MLQGPGAVVQEHVVWWWLDQLWCARARTQAPIRRPTCPRARHHVPGHACVPRQIADPVAGVDQGTLPLRHRQSIRVEQHLQVPSRIFGHILIIRVRVCSQGLGPYRYLPNQSCIVHIAAELRLIFQQPVLCYEWKGNLRRWQGHLWKFSLWTAMGA